MATSIPLPLVSTNKSIPYVGLGTATFPFARTKAVKEVAVEAIELGYRHFDTSPVYHTEKFIGQAIIEASSRGLIESRDDLFITSKLWPSDAHGDTVLPALQSTLKELGLEYLDSYLIHWPIAMKEPGKHVYPFDKEDLLPIDYKAVWEAMEECQRLGLTKSIGVSNFTCKKLDNLLSLAKIPPAVNQIEMTPLWQQKKLRAFCTEKGIVITAYSPLGAKGTNWGSNNVLGNKVLRDIAQGKGKTVAQICLRWLYEQGVTCVPKSFNKNRMKENLDIFDWQLSSEEMKKISEIPPQKMYDGSDFISKDGPYKSPEEFWDGEI